MKSFVTFLALFVAGCGDATLPGDSADAGRIPSGTYVSCARGLRAAAGSPFLTSDGFEPGTSLTLAQSGTTLTATYVDLNGVSQSLAFAPGTSGSATLNPTGPLRPDASGSCVQGLGRISHFPALMDLTAGALTYDAGSLFMMLEGGLQSDAGPCGIQSAPASSWLLCTERQGGALPSVDTGAAPAVQQLPAGPYACRSQVETYDLVGGIKEYVSGGGSGTLTLAQTGAELTAQYSGDSAVAGTLRLGSTSAKTANALAGQTLFSPCMVPIGTGSSRPPTPAMLPIAAGALAIGSSTIFLSFAGTMDASSSCPGAQVAGSVLCSR